MSTPAVHDRSRTTSSPEPVSAHAVPILANLRRRRERLDQHRAEALQITAEALAAGHLAAWQHVPEISGDRTRRRRESQLLGDDGMPLEDVAAVGLEGPVGREVACLILRALLARIEPQPGRVEVEAAGADLAREVGHALDALFTALVDREITADEASAVLLEVDHVERACRAIRQALASRDSWRAEVGRRVVVRQAEKSTGAAGDGEAR